MISPCDLNDVCMNGGTCIDLHATFSNLKTEVSAFYTTDKAAIKGEEELKSMAPPFSIHGSHGSFVMASYKVFM